MRALLQHEPSPYQLPYQEHGNIRVATREMHFPRMFVSMLDKLADVVGQGRRQDTQRCRLH